MTARIPAARPSRFPVTIPMPENATCPRCHHASRSHGSGTCLEETRPSVVNEFGGGTWYLCGCAVWQGPRPWLGEGPAWARR